MGRQSTAKSEATRHRKKSTTPVSKKRSTPEKPASSKTNTATETASTPTAPPKRATTASSKPKRTAASKSASRSSRNLRSVFSGFGTELARVSSYPLTSYYLILISVLALTALGLVMVLSASSITSYDGGAGSSFALFNRQAVFIAIGLALMIAAMFLPLEWWKRLSWWGIVLGIAMQAAVFVPGVGKSTKGNANWIQLPGDFQLQPSEFLKIALAVWLGFVLAQKAGRMKTFGRAMIPVVPGIGIAVGLVVAGNDLGTALILMAMALVCLFIGGFPWKYFLLLFAGLAGLTVFYVLSSANRLARIQALLTGHADQTFADTTGQQWQSNHGLYALASGGWFGVGLGASREKWSWLPEAHNDFIFAIIGEELGLLGSLVVILVFAALAYGVVRVIMRSNDLFIQITSAGLFTWLIGQAAINIAVVAGLLPVIGLPLPFVSYGGSSIIASLLAVGILLSFARTEDGADTAIRAQQERLRSSFAVLVRKRKK